MIHRIDPIIGRVVICQCPNPIIKCDQYDCICTGCGLPSIHDLSLGKKSKGLKDETIIEHLLLSIGEDPEREGLKETPARVIKAWKEWASGYNQ